jgi:hypothetical protein
MRFRGREGCKRIHCFFVFGHKLNYCGSFCPSRSLSKRSYYDPTKRLKLLFIVTRLVARAEESSTGRATRLIAKFMALLGESLVLIYKISG